MRALSIRRQTVAVVAAGVMLTLAGAAPAMAQDLNQVAQTILNELNSTFLQLVAAVAVIGIAMAMMFGMLRPMMGFMVLTGIGLAASATTIANKFFGA
jgi:type IV secretory pathway VirB2 component (pilin)